MGTLEAVLISYSSNIIIANNKYSSLKGAPSTGAFHLYRSHDIQLINNEVTSSNNAIVLIASPNNQIKGNRIFDAPYGIALFQSSNDNNVDSNIISADSINIFLMDSNGNNIQRNNFLVRQRQAHDNGVNVWNQNYWDDYSGSDGDGDGLGDAPYAISETSVDAAPKVEPYPARDVPVPALIPTDLKELPQGEAIREDTVWKNRVVELTQPYLVIENCAKLTIKGCELVAQEPGAGKHIFVRPGASLYIYDSFLRGDGINSYITIRMEQGASLVIKDSKIHYAGDWGGNSGIQLFGDGAVIENNEIMGSYFGVDIRGSSHHRIVNNKIWNCVDGIVIFGESADNIIEGNQVSGCVEDIFQEQVLRH